MTQPSKAHTLLVPALLVVVPSTACHFDARARPHDESGQQAATALPPDIDAAVVTAPAPPAAGQPAPAIEPRPGGGPASSGAAAPVAMQPDAAAPPFEASDTGAPAADAAATPDAAVFEDAAADAMAVDAMTVDAGSSGAAFSACHAHADCDNGLWCTGVAWGTSTAGGYCTAICGSGGGMTDNGCLQPGSGSLTASCQPTTALCELGSCDRQSCPEGLRCARVETPIGGGQVVYAFVCGP